MRTIAMFCFGCILTTSCMSQSKAIFKLKPEKVESTVNTLLRFDGVYYCHSYKPGERLGRSIYFYTNGAYIELPGNSNEVNIRDTVSYINDIVDSDRMLDHNIELWGVYIIRNDTLYTERIALNPSNPPSKNYIYNTWLIKKNSIQLLKRSIKSKAHVFAAYKEEDFYVPLNSRNIFYQSEMQKPDSTKAWFYNKSWFVK